MKRWIGGIALLLIVGAVWLREHDRPAAGAAHSNRQTGAVVSVSVTDAEGHDFHVKLPALGTVTPLSTVTVTSHITGTLAQVLFREGQMVKQNELLAVIDPRPYQAALLQAQGQLERDEAALRNARIDLSRYRNALRDHAIPEQQAATAQAAVDADEGTVKLDRGEVDAAQVNLDYTRITSPIEGRVGLRQVDAGNIVSANGSPGITTIVQLQPMAVVFTVAQRDLPDIEAEMRQGESVGVEVFDRTRKTPIAEGRLLSIDNLIDPTTGTIRMKGEFANADGALWPGEFVDVQVDAGVDRNAVTVPARAVQQGPDGDYLFVVQPDLTVAMRAVGVKRVANGLAEIARGLAAGERVVVDGQFRLESGTKVAVRPAEEKSPGN